MNSNSTSSILLPTLNLMRIREDADEEGSGSPSPSRQFSRSPFAYSFQRTVQSPLIESLHTLAVDFNKTETSIPSSDSGKSYGSVGQSDDGSPIPLDPLQAIKISAAETAGSLVGIVDVMKPIPLEPIRIPDDFTERQNAYNPETSPSTNSQNFHPHSPGGDHLIAITDIAGHLIVGSKRLFSLLGISAVDVVEGNLSLSEFIMDPSVVCDYCNTLTSDTAADKILHCGTVTRLKPSGVDDDALSIPVSVWMKLRREGANGPVLLWIFDRVSEIIADIEIENGCIVSVKPSIDTFKDLFNFGGDSAEGISIEKIVPDFKFISGMPNNQSRALNTLDGQRFPADISFVDGNRIHIRAFDNISGLLIADESGDINSFNESFLEKLLGYSADKVPKNVEEILPDFSRLCADASVQQQSSPSPSDMRFTYGYFAIHKDGSKLPVQIHSRRLNEKSKVLIALWISFDRPGSILTSPVIYKESAMALLPTKTAKIPSNDRDPMSVKPLTQAGNSDRLSSSQANHSIDRYNIIAKIGQGAFGEVFRVVHKSAPSTHYVIKCIYRENVLKDGWVNDDDFGMVPREIQILNYIRKSGGHSAIVKLTNAFQDQKFFYLEMAMHGDGMDLFDYIDLTPLVAESNVRKIFQQICQAVKFLHDCGVVHRDIKDENVVIDSKLQVQLIDFGSAAWVPKDGSQFSVFCGTIDYCPPEILKGQRYSGPPQDIWALGILMYTLTYRENPFYNSDEILTHPIRFPYILSNASVAIIKYALQRDVQKRPNIDQLLAHKWFNN